MKLIIQIPCFNEEHTLRKTLTDLPKKIPGVDCIEIQIINDGSTDKTVEVALACNVHHIVSFKKNRGLAAAFKAGIDNALAQKADILVNTDGDNQYKGSDIVNLIQPILNGEADVVVGCRPIDEHPEFSPLKKLMQKLGSWVLRKFSTTTVRDATSGFRAFDRNALLSLNIYTEFSYTLETLIQNGLCNLKIVCVDVGVNLKTRESRLFRNMLQFIWRQSKTLISIFLLYRANWFFNVLAGLMFLLGGVLVIRYLFLVFFADSPASDFWPSIVFAGVLFSVGFQLFLTGVLASLISFIRKLSEDTNRRIKKMDIESTTEHRS